ncbi:ALF repeat-containing protein [Streptomyces syringium]
MTRIGGTGGPAVKAAARKALMGTEADLRRFLDTGQYEALAKDAANVNAQAKVKAKARTARTRSWPSGSPGTCPWP